MATIHAPKTANELNKYNLAQVKKMYLEIGTDLMMLYNGDFKHCEKCDSWASPESFYKDKRFKSGIFPICKSCLDKMSGQIKKSGDKSNETEQSIQRVLMMMDRPWIYQIYLEAVTRTKEDRLKGSFHRVFPTYMDLLYDSDYKNKSWTDSEFKEIDDPVEVTDEDLREVDQSVIKKWGAGFAPYEYDFLENEYAEWISDYECNNKTQEELFKNIAFNQLETYHARRAGKPTKDLVKSFQDMLDTMTITPKQNKVDQFKDGQTFGTLIQKWEETEPLPELDEDLLDVEHIARVEDIMLAHTCKTAGINTPYSENYQKFIDNFTCYPPDGLKRAESADLFNALFGDANEQ